MLIDDPTIATWLGGVMTLTLTFTALGGAIHLLRRFKGMGIWLLSCGVLMIGGGMSSYELLILALSKGTGFITSDRPDDSLMEFLQHVGLISWLLELLGFFLVVLSMFFLSRTAVREQT